MQGGYKEGRSTFFFWGGGFEEMGLKEWSLNRREKKGWGSGTFLWVGRKGREV